MNVVNTLQIIVANMLIYSTPLIFTSIGGVFSERGGIVSLALISNPSEKFVFEAFTSIWISLPDWSNARIS